MVREAGRRVLNMRHFDVQLIGGMTLHRGMIAEMKTGEGKTLVATLAAYLNALRRQGRPRRHGERLPGQARLRVDGPALPLPGPHGRRDPAQHGRPRAPGRLRRRHHVRHQQRVRLRLPARQHEVRPRDVRAARPPLRGRGRGRLDPDRRGADAAHHQRPRRGVDRQVLPGRPDHPEAQAGRAHHRRQEGRGARRAREDRRLHRRREGQDRHAHRDGHGARREAARR